MVKNIGYSEIFWSWNGFNNNNRINGVCFMFFYKVSKWELLKVF